MTIKLTDRGFPQSSKDNVDLAYSFVEAFGAPSADNEDDVPRVTVHDFDVWARSNGLYRSVDTSSKEEVNRARTTVRHAVNNVATGDVWVDEFGERAFSVQVLEHGVSYRVISSMSGFLSSGQALPQRVQSISDTRFNQLSAFLDSADFSNMTTQIQMEAGMQLARIEDWKGEQALVLSNMEKRFRQLRDKVREHQKSKTPGQSVPALENNDA